MIKGLLFSLIVALTKSENYLYFNEESGNFEEKPEFDGYDGQLNFKRGVYLTEGDILLCYIIKNKI